MASPTLPRTRSASSLRSPAVAHDRTPPGARLPARPGRPPAGAALAGRYRYHVPTGSWWWSAEMYALHRLSPDGSEPTAELLLRHQHPDDRDGVLAALAAACEDARPFCLEIRLHTHGEEPRRVVMLGEPEVDGGGQVTAVSGLMAEMSGCRLPENEEREALRSEIEQLRTAMASRAAIEQAKGIIMLLTGCGEEVSFRLLAHISSHTHRKVREVATAITESASGRGRLPDDVRAILRDACPPGGGMR